MVNYKEKLVKLFEGSEDFKIREFTQKYLTKIKKSTDWKVVLPFNSNISPYKRNGLVYLAMYTKEIEKPFPLAVKLYVYDQSSSPSSAGRFANISGDNTLLIEPSMFPQQWTKLKQQGMSDEKLINYLIKGVDDTIIHELTHFYDHIRIKGKDINVVKADKDGVKAYAQSPLESNAFFIELTYEFIKYLKSKSMYGSDNMYPKYSLKNNYSVFKWEFDNFIKKSSKEIIFGFNKYKLRDLLEPKGKRQYDKRVIQLWNDIKDGKIKW